MTAAGQTAKHTYEFAESYTVTLTVTDLDGTTDTATELIEVIELVDGFSDEFDEPDGAAPDWTVSQGDWSILNEELVTTSFGGENWIWAGEPPLEFGGRLEMNFTYRRRPAARSSNTPSHPPAATTSR